MRFLRTILFLWIALSARTAMSAIDFIGEVRASNYSGKLVIPTNFFAPNVNLYAGSNIFLQSTGKTGLLIHGQPGSGVGTATATNAVVSVSSNGVTVAASASTNLNFCWDGNILLRLTNVNGNVSIGVYVQSNNFQAAKLLLSNIVNNPYTGWTNLAILTLNGFGTNTTLVTPTILGVANVGTHWRVFEDASTNLLASNDLTGVTLTLDRGTQGLYGQLHGTSIGTNQGAWNVAGTINGWNGVTVRSGIYAGNGNGITNLPTSLTNATHIDMRAGFRGLKTQFGGRGIIGTNESGTNVVWAVDPAVLLTTNASQFLGVPLSIKDGAFLTNIVHRGTNSFTDATRTALSISNAGNFNNEIYSGVNGDLRFFSGDASSDTLFLDADGATVTLSLTLQSGVRDNANLSGTAGQVLTSTGGGIRWSNAPVSRIDLTTTSNALQTATSNNVTVAAGANVTVTTNGSAGVMTYTVAASSTASTADVQIFTNAGTATWTKPSGASAVYVYCVGGGGGGGGGAPGNTSTWRVGGAGGAGGNWTTATVPSALVGATETITVGAGGTGGEATNGFVFGRNGTSGGASSFGSWVSAGGGASGSGGVGSDGGANGCINSACTATAGSPSSSGGYTFIGASGASGITGTVGTPTAVVNAAGGGAAGGGISNVNAPAAGGVGGAIVGPSTQLAGGTAGTASGGNAGVGGSRTPKEPYGGSGGGGGGGNQTGNGGTGGKGGLYGGGGGGGGTCITGSTSGAGGDGGPGIVVVVTVK